MSACSKMIPPGAVLDGRVVRDRSGAVLADYSGATCGTTTASPAARTAAAPPAAAGTAATRDPLGPFEEFSLSYLDEDAAPMWTGLIASFQIPGAPPRASADQAYRWFSRMWGAATGSTPVDAFQLLEAGVSYGAWPGISGTSAGRYYAWASIRQDAGYTFYSTPVEVHPGAEIDLRMQLTFVRQPNPAVEPPEVAILDPASVFFWDLNITVDGQPLPTMSVSTMSLGRLDWDAVWPAVMDIYNVPGGNISTCAEALPPGGAIVFGPLLAATSTPQAPTSPVWAVPDMVRYGTLPGTAGVACDPWGEANVTLAGSTVMLAWPTGLLQSPPPAPPSAVPAAGPPFVVALGCLLMMGAAVALARRRP